MFLHLVKCISRAIRVIWGVQEGQMFLQYSSTKNSWKGPNRKYKYFLNDYFGGLQTKKKKNLRSDKSSPLLNLLPLKLKFLLPKDDFATPSQYH